MNGINVLMSLESSYQQACTLEHQLLQDNWPVRVTCSPHTSSKFSSHQKLNSYIFSLFFTRRKTLIRDLVCASSIQIIILFLLQSFFLFQRKRKHSYV